MADKSRNYLVDFLVILVLVAAGYAAYRFIPLYVGHYRLKNDVREIMVRAARHTPPRKLKDDIRAAAREHELELEHDDVILDFGSSLIKVQFEYERSVPIPASGKEIIIHFRVEDEKDLTTP